MKLESDYYVYQADPTKKKVGWRWLHVPSKTKIHVFAIETNPQASILVHTRSDANNGVPHALEHLLSGKGPTARSAENKTYLNGGRSTARSLQHGTLFQFSSGAWSPFFGAFKQHLSALLAADFTDQEAEGELYKVSLVPDDNGLRAVENGTVYNEMRGIAAQRAGAFAMEQLVLGNKYPLSFDAGGVPDEMRAVKPDMVRAFHATHYKLGANMSIVLVIPPEQVTKANIGVFGRTMDEVYARYQQRSDSLQSFDPSPELTPVQKVIQIPDTSNTGTIRLQLAGSLQKFTSIGELIANEAFLEALAGDSDAWLGKKLVEAFPEANITVRARWRSSLSPQHKFPVIQISGLPSTDQAVFKAKQVVLKGLAILRGDGFLEKDQFIESMKAYIISEKRDVAFLAMDPPQFGQRLGPRPGNEENDFWHKYLANIDVFDASSNTHDLGCQDAFTKATEYVTADWKKMILSWNDSIPYAVLFRPLASPPSDEEKSSADRMSAFVTSVRSSNPGMSDQELLKKYNAQQDVPTLPSNTPTQYAFPKTIDDTLHYRKEMIDGVPVMASYFDSDPRVTLGWAFDLKSLPQKFYVYLPILPDLFDKLGLLKNEKKTSADDLEREQVQKLADFSVRLEYDPRAQRYELVFEFQGNSKEESLFGISYVDRITHDNDLSPSNAYRLQKLIEQAIEKENKVPSQAQEKWVPDLAKAVRFIEDDMHRAMGAFPSRLHLLNRLRWRMNVPNHDLVQKLRTVTTKIKEAKRVDRVWELVNAEISGTPELKKYFEYCRQQLKSVPESQVFEGILHLLQDGIEDLAYGPEKMMIDVKSLLANVLKKNKLQQYYAGPSSVFLELKEPLSVLNKKYPNQPNSDYTKPDGNLVDKVLAGSQSYYFAYITEGDKPAAAVVTAALSSTSSVTDKNTLLRVLALKYLSGPAPHSVSMRMWNEGLAYTSLFHVSLTDGTVSYLLDNTSDIKGAFEFLRSKILPDAIALPNTGAVDYAYGQFFQFSESWKTHAERGIGHARRFRNGQYPEYYSRISRDLLEFSNPKNQSGLWSEIATQLPLIVDRVLLPAEDTAQKNVDEGRRLFFFVGSDKQIPKLNGMKVKQLSDVDFWKEQ